MNLLLHSLRFPKQALINSKPFQPSLTPAYEIRLGLRKGIRAREEVLGVFPYIHSLRLDWIWLSVQSIKEATRSRYIWPPGPLKIKKRTDNLLVYLQIYS